MCHFCILSSDSVNERYCNQWLRVSNPVTLMHAHRWIHYARAWHASIIICPPPHAGHSPCMHVCDENIDSNTHFQLRSPFCHDDCFLLLLWHDKCMAIKCKCAYPVWISQQSFCSKGLHKPNVVMSRVCCIY